MWRWLFPLIGLGVWFSASAAAQAQEATPAPEVAPAPEKGKGKAKGTRKKVKLSGYVQMFFKQRFDNDGDGEVEASLFRMHRVRLKVSGDLAPWLAYQVEIDPRAPAIGGVLRDAFIDLRLIPHHRIRIGQQKTPFGYENRESSSRLYTVTRTELAEGPGRGLTLRDIGVALIGRIPLGGSFSVEDHLAVVNGAGMNVQVDETNAKNFWGRIGGRYRDKERHLTVWLGMSVGIGDMTEPAEPGPPPVEALLIEFQRFGADLEVDSPWVFFAAEVATSTNELPSMPEDSDESIAYSAMVAGKTPWDVGPVVRYDMHDLEEFVRWTFGAYYGAPDDAFRAMATFEVFEDEAGPHDHRLLLWTQARF